MTTDDKTPNFILHICPIRDECWQDVNERSLGSMSKCMETLVRPHPCGFEATTLAFCPKYRQWSGDAEVVNG